MHDIIVHKQLSLQWTKAEVFVISDKFHQFEYHV